jgi:hypothetical protein
MSPISIEDLQSGSVRALATDIAAGVTQELKTKEGSKCHFFESFECAGYKVRLRLDWKDLDDHGNPIMDADFYHPKTCAIDKSMKAHRAHHTRAGASGERIYEWEFADQSRHLQVTLIWCKALSSELTMQASLSSSLIRADEA